MTKKELQDVTRMFRALSVKTRLEILQLLSKRTLCVGALSGLLGITAGAVSQHLRILSDAGLVEADRRGSFIHYSITPLAAERCRKIMKSLFSPAKHPAKHTCSQKSRSPK